MTQLEPHFFASYLASEVACDILEVMPSTDLIEDLRNLIYIQCELFSCIVQGKHYGTDSLNEFVNSAQEIRNQVARLREKMEWPNE